MKEKFVFREMLKEIKELADQKGNVLTEEEVRNFFQDSHFNDEQMKMIFEYLAGQNIQVLGYEEQHENLEEDLAEWAGQESEYLSFYEEELQNIQIASQEEKIEVIQSVMRGDAMAKVRLIEMYLPIVAKIAKEYEKKELPLGDLIQEGNIGLMMAVDGLSGTARILEADMFLQSQIRGAIEEAIEMQRDSRHAGEEIAERVNYLSEAIHNLEEELEHKVSVEELSAYLEIPTDEIEDILRMAGDEIEMEGNEHHQHHHGHHHEHENSLDEEE